MQRVYAIELNPHVIQQIVYVGTPQPVKKLFDKVHCWRKSQKHWQWGVGEKGGSVRASWTLEQNPDCNTPKKCCFNTVQWGIVRDERFPDNYFLLLGPATNRTCENGELTPWILWWCRTWWVRSIFPWSWAEKRFPKGPSLPRSLDGRRHEAFHSGTNSFCDKERG